MRNTAFVVAYILAGFGGGKVIQVGKATVNTFVEPQYTVYHHGG
jgi:hypothetical protein